MRWNGVPICRTIHRKGSSTGPRLNGRFIEWRRRGHHVLWVAQLRRRLGWRRCITRNRFDPLTFRYGPHHASVYFVGHDRLRRHHLWRIHPAIRAGATSTTGIPAQQILAMLIVLQAVPAALVLEPTPKTWLIIAATTALPVGKPVTRPATIGIVPCTADNSHIGVVITEVMSGATSQPKQHGR